MLRRKLLQLFSAAAFAGTGWLMGYGVLRMPLPPPPTEGSICDCLRSWWCSCQLNQPGCQDPYPYTVWTHADYGEANPSPPPQCTVTCELKASYCCCAQTCPFSPCPNA
jgi:hypothetical protein